MSQVGSSSISVMYVDDEPDFANLVATHLERGDERIEVDVHTSATDALETLHNGGGAVDCVVSDYEMPGTDGLGLLEAVREEWPDLPFVLFTGRGSEDIASEAISRGVTEYMQKATDPQQFEVLANRVRNAVDKYQTERQLERTETRYRRLVEQNLTGIYIVQDGEVAYANPKCEEIFGYSQEELTGMSAFDLVAEEDHEDLRRAIETSEAGEIEEMHYTLTGVRKGGERFEFEVHSGQIDYEGEPAVLGSLVDVTEQRERERELEEYRELVETVGDPMYVLDETGHVVKANRAMSEMLGHDPEDLVGLHASDFLDEEIVDAGREMVQRFVSGASEPPETFEVEFRTADGDRIPCETNVTTLADEDGEFRGSVGVVRVIAERKERERELEEYETIVETAPDGIFILDRDGYLVSGNRTGAEMVGYEREEITGRHFSDLIDAGVLEPSVADRYVDLVEELLSGRTDRKKAKFETQLRPTDGGERTCEIHIALLRNDDGSYRGTVGVIRDITERKAIEEALRSERDRLSALFENIPEASLVYEFVDGEPVVRQVNDAFERTFGYDEAEVLGGSIDDFIVQPEASEGASELNEQVLAGERLDVEIKRVRADGEVRDFHFRNAPIQAEGRVQGYALYTDITERKQSQERIQALFEFSTDCIVETTYEDGAPVVERTNAAFEETFGYDSAEIREVSLDDLIVPADRREEARRLNRRIRNGEAVEEEVTRLTADGERDFLLRSVPFDVGGGNRTYAVYTDITERKERERRLEALHDATRDLMEATSIGDVVEIGLDAAERVLGMEIAGFYRHDADRNALEPVEVTDRATELFGVAPTFDRGDGIAWQVWETGVPVNVDDLREHADTYNPDTPVRSELILPTGDHGVFIAGAEETEAFDQVEQFLAQVLVSNVETALDRARRETLLREREQALLRQNERLEEFAGVVSHDLRSPLTVAKGNVYLARTEEGEQYLDRIERALDRMEQLIDDLLSLARQGETVDGTEVVELPEAANEAWSTVDTGAATMTIEPDAECAIEADEGRLRELLENLFGNSVEHGASGGAEGTGESVGGDVTVTVGGIEDGFYVEDDGEGFSEEARENLFDLGYTTRDGGTGFGLSIVKQIAEAHGWTVEATAGADGGARFEFTGVAVVEQHDGAS